MATAEQSTKAGRPLSGRPGPRPAPAPAAPALPWAARAPAAHPCSSRADSEQNQDDVHNLDFQLLLRNRRIWDASGGLSGGAAASAQGVTPGSQDRVHVDSPQGPASPSARVSVSLSVSHE
ncbi:hypothetical protein VULLAG_LOCUS15473 [Vulpes lagopus]